MQTLHFDRAALELLSGAPATRAKAEKPRIRVVSFGNYEAQSSDGKRWYSITCNSATKEMVCGCPARKPCKHLAAILPVHIHLAKERAAAAAPVLVAQPAQEAEEIVLYCQCGAIWPDAYTGRCQACEQEYQDYRQGEEFCESRGY
jgi:hypothetical protein